MTNIISEYAFNAQLSLAAYASFENIINNADLITRLEQAGMSKSQARLFLGFDESNQLIPGKGFEIIDHYIPNKGDRFIIDMTMTRRTLNAKAGENHIKGYAAPYCAAWT